MGLSHSKHEEQQMKSTSTLLVAVLAAFALPVLAQTSTPNIDQRQANQQQRIDQGVKSGQLTGKEAARLEKGQEHVQKVEDKAKADGVVTKKERARIQHAENVQSRHIAREKHDRQRDMNHDGKKDRPGRK
jgi:uncharacterized membrane protein YebE (DUF533 family)